MPNTNDRPTDLSRQMLFLLAGLAALGSLATNIILPVFPGMGRDLGVETRDLALTLSSFFIAFAVGQIFAGPLADRFGRQPVVIGGLVVFVAGSAICAFAPTLHGLILGRVVQATGASAAFVLARAIARDLFDGDALARALVLIMIAMAAAPGFSPLLGTGFGALLGWRYVFAGVAVFAIVLGVLYARRLGETQPATARQPLQIGAVARAYARLAADSRFIYPALSVSFTVGMLYAFFAAAPAIFINALGLSGLQLSLYFAGTVFIVFGAGLSAPRLAARWGQARIAFLGTVIALIGNLVMLGVAVSPDLWLITGGLALFLLGMGLINPLGTAIALQPFKQEAGLASALQGFLQMACAGVASTVASMLPVQATLALAVTMTAGSIGAVVVFLPVVFKKPKPEVAQ